MIRFLLAILLVFGLVWTLPAAEKDLSDDAIFDQVRLKLASDSTTGAFKIDVAVKDGVVELTGKVKTDKARQKAERIAKKVKGVKTVSNRLETD